MLVDNGAGPLAKRPLAASMRIHAEAALQRAEGTSYRVRVMWHGSGSMLLAWCTQLAEEEMPILPIGERKLWYTCTRAQRDGRSSDLYSEHVLSLPSVASADVARKH